jgi:hypothetical protein
MDVRLEIRGRLGSNYHGSDRNTRLSIEGERQVNVFGLCLSAQS